MKKSLLALALLGAFAGVASAQSAVTIYGKVDLSLAKGNDGTSSLTGAPTGDKLQLMQQAGSRVGFRGTEDLGGGLKANFQIEHRFTPDDGVANAVHWNGMSWVGLSGSFGEIRLGRDYAPFFWPAIAADPWGFDTVAQVGIAHSAAGIVVYRYGNLLSYRTPDMGGLTAQVGIGLAEKDDTEHNMGFNVQYKGGPLYAGFGYHRGPASGSAHHLLSAAALGALSADDPATAWTLTGSYDLTVVKLIGSFSMSEVEATGADLKARGVTLAATAPLGGGDLRASANRLEGTNGAIDDTKLTKFSLGYHYPLSKRTKLYADVGTAKQTDRDRRTAVDLGIQHNF
ncbi:porin [Eleftheria terrae]|uniref:porin n=1 Tax=Eleftheria terrae TaxID=1597781 RepID=UPI00263A774F|nr:porin [Eleftheria terrae]WKB54904.1 porin [Eleftheria terrae]